MDEEVKERALFFIKNVMPIIFLFLLFILSLILCYQYRSRTGMFENRQNSYVRMNTNNLRRNIEEE